MTKKEYYERLNRGWGNLFKNHPEFFGPVHKKDVVEGDFSNEQCDPIEVSEEEEANRRLSTFYCIRGEALAEKGYTDKAIADFTSAIRLSPDHVRSYHNRGKVYADKGDADKAIADFTEAIRLDPYVSEAYYYSRGAVYQKIGDIDKAVADYKETQRVSPPSDEARMAKEALAKLNKSLK